jgi:hypothetical protein
VAGDTLGGVGPVQVVEFQVRIGGQASCHLGDGHVDDLGRAFDTTAHPGGLGHVVGGHHEEQHAVLGEQATFEAAQARIDHSQHPQYR